MARRDKEERYNDGFADLGTFVLGGLVGGLVGAVVGVWFAPRSGVDTRDEIKERGLEIRAQAEMTAARARERVSGPSPDSILSEAKAAARRYRDDLEG